MKGKAFLFLENPWSRSKFQIQYQRKTVNHHLDLQNKPFLQKCLAKKGGYLYIAYNCRCAYDKSYPQKPCNCQKMNGRTLHKKKIQSMSSKYEKAKWPIEVVFLLFELCFYSVIQGEVE